MADAGSGNEEVKPERADAGSGNEEVKLDRGRAEVTDGTRL
jgi:hypothetical protein